MIDISLQPWRCSKPSENGQSLDLLDTIYKSQTAPSLYIWSVRLSSTTSATSWLRIYIEYIQSCTACAFPSHLPLMLGQAQDIENSCLDLKWMCVGLTLNIKNPVWMSHASPPWADGRNKGKEKEKPYLTTQSRTWRGTSSFYQGTPTCMQDSCYMREVQHEDVGNQAVASYSDACTEFPLYNRSTSRSDFILSATHDIHTTFVLPWFITCFPASGTSTAFRSWDQTLFAWMIELFHSISRRDRSRLHRFKKNTISFHSLGHCAPCPQSVRLCFWSLSVHLRIPCTR
jgi:hypothetical protein